MENAVCKLILRKMRENCSVNLKTFIKSIIKYTRNNHIIPDKMFFSFFKPSSRNSVNTTPLSGNSSRRGSGDGSILVDPDASLSELRVNCIFRKFRASLNRKIVL